MSIEELSSLGELVASLGVVISLMYLAVQTKANTKAVRSQTRSSLTDQVLLVQSTAFQSNEFLVATIKFRNEEQLSELELELLFREAMMFFKHMENSQYQYDEGVYDKNEYEAQLTMWVRRFTNSPSWIDAWDRLSGAMSPRLAAVVQPIVDEIKKNNSIKAYSDAASSSVV